METKIHTLMYYKHSNQTKQFTFSIFILNVEYFWCYHIMIRLVAIWEVHLAILSTSFQLSSFP